MLEYIKAHFGTILLVVVAFVVGVTTGVNTQENDKGIYISMNYPNGAPMFELGKNDQSVSNIDFGSLTSDEVGVVISKISSTTSETEFGSKVRELANHGDGPFAPIPIDLDVHLVRDDPFIMGPVAKACLNSRVLGNALVAYEWLDSHNVPKKGLMDIHPVRKEQSCSSHESDKYTLWLNRSYAEGALGIPSDQGDVVSIKANMIVSILSL